MIRDISKLESEQENLPDPRVNSNLHENTNLHDATRIRTPMVPVDVNVIVETIDETKTELQTRVKRKLLAEVTTVWLNKKKFIMSI